MQQLLEAGEDVTIATRGLQADPFGDRVRRIKLDRESLESLQMAAQSSPNRTDKRLLARCYLHS